MPGTIWTITCAACTEMWLVHPGALPHKSRLPAVCNVCRQIVTADRRENGPWLCPTCNTQCAPLPAAELNPGEELPESLDGVACPRCSAEALTALETGLWD